MPRLQVNGIQLYYESHGEGEPVLFLHGLGSSTRDWEYQVPAFASAYRVITLDLRGHGRSEKPPGPYRLTGFAADIAEFLRLMGIGAAHVVGLSMGGCVAFQLAVDAPERVKTLTIVNSAPDVLIRTWLERLIVWERLALVRVLGVGRLGRTLGKRLFIKSEQSRLREVFAARWAENDRAAYLAAFRAMIGWSVLDQLGSIRCPTLIMAADQDYTPVSRKEAYVARLSNARLVIIADSRHLVPVERPEAFNPVLRDFLDEHLG